ncbi:hypothetical protein [Gelidibacter mesophilus]|uniref:hypothetical protein n=1 Tax=Gelidibacter mesophilus TaxID=169050 RepID=UPI0003FBE5D0|nr:hypothetical protein [Gelidibacter mesophilus]
MKTKSTLLFTCLFFLFSNLITAQKDIKIDLDALKFFNSYLSNKSLIDDRKTELIFDKYSNALNYSSTVLMYENPTTEKDIYYKSNVTYPIPLNNIERIVEDIYQDGETVVMQYVFYLDKEVKRIIEKKEKGEWLDKTETNVNKVFFPIAIHLDNEEVKNIQKVVRDVFSNVDIETILEKKR